MTRLVGQQTGEGAAYRVDLRLRPHGRDGALSCSLSEAIRYYQQIAQAWELQALLRARAAAGTAALYARFADSVRARVYGHAETVAQALANVRLAKQKIDRQHTPDRRGYNVKLGRGGIREIEFIAQALQLAHGGHDAWLQHAPHTLVSLGRLAERALLTERERATLSDAYAFLRTLEHRLQMEHGLQTHALPDEPARRTLVARRMNYTGAHALADFNHALAQHTAHVRAAYDRVFGDAAPNSAPVNVSSNATADKVANAASSVPISAPLGGVETSAALALGAAVEATAAHQTAVIFAAHSELNQNEQDLSAAPAATMQMRIARVAQLLHTAARDALNPGRALTLLGRIAASLDKAPEEAGTLNAPMLKALVQLCGASEYFGELLASQPALLRTLPADAAVVAARDYRALLRAQIDLEHNFAAELATLRRTWAQLTLELGAGDVAGAFSLPELNRLQTALATAGINAAYLIARRELARRYGALAAGPRLCVFGLGRLGSGGMDYGSDLDLVIVYDDKTAAPLRGHTHDEAYAQLAALMTGALSSVTREGYLYRVDLRLRPDGNNGPLVRGAQSFIEYVATRTDVWEWLAYVKLRAVGGDLELGRALETRARAAIHTAAQQHDRAALRLETRRVRARLEHERAGRAAQSRTLDIKFGAGGMLDVYFATRYLQLRADVPDQDPDRSTAATLARLRAANALSHEDHQALAAGYTLLRTLDHHLRLIAGRTARLPTTLDHPLLHDLTRRLAYSSPAQLLDAIHTHTQAIRAAYERITA